MGRALRPRSGSPERSQNLSGHLPFWRHRQLQRNLYRSFYRTNYKGSYLYYFMASQAVYRAEAGSDRGSDLTFAYDNSPNSTTSTELPNYSWRGLSRHYSAANMDQLSFGFVSTRTSNASSQANELLFGLSARVGESLYARLPRSAQAVSDGAADDPVLQHDRGQSVSAEWSRHRSAHRCRF